MSGPMISKARLLTEVMLAVFRVNGKLVGWGDRLVAPIGLTSARSQVLGAISQSGVGLTAPQIGAAIGITRQGVQKQLNALLGEGLVESRSNPVHARSPLWVLSPDGRKRIEAASTQRRFQAASLAQGMNASDLRVTLDLLDRLHAHLSNDDSDHSENA